MNNPRLDFNSQLLNFAMLQNLQNRATLFQQSLNTFQPILASTSLFLSPVQTNWHNFNLLTPKTLVKNSNSALENAKTDVLQKSLLNKIEEDSLIKREQPANDSEIKYSRVDESKNAFPSKSDFLQNKIENGLKLCPDFPKKLENSPINDKQGDRVKKVIKEAPEFEKGVYQRKFQDKNVLTVEDSTYKKAAESIGSLAFGDKVKSIISMKLDNDSNDLVFLVRWKRRNKKFRPKSSYVSRTEIKEVATDAYTEYCKKMHMNY